MIQQMNKKDICKVVNGISGQFVLLKTTYCVTWLALHTEENKQ